MIVFELSTDRGLNRLIYWLGMTSLTGDDKEHSDEIYEQLTVEDVHMDGEV